MQQYEAGFNPLAIKGSLERQEIAKQLATLRVHERADRYTMDRNASEYYSILDGYIQSLFYVKQLGSSKVVLDIGAGTTKAISEISESPEGKGLELEFRATVLTYTPAIEENLGLVNTHITPAETLSGIDDNSVGLALAVYSITYSVRPDATIDRINDILVPGGILKGTFFSEKEKGVNASIASRITPFQRRLRELNYDIALGPNEVILAKKPGGHLAVSAQDLLEADRHERTSFFQGLSTLYKS